mmetsp:Transcript_22316/g.45722  ORF Transcript_22316/g.45722 Transcript_22316/m.45722 type:complete len:546 (+) Transcript_22316:3-1640(+)
MIVHLLLLASPPLAQSISSQSPRNIATPIPPIIDTTGDDGPLRFHETTFLTSRNAHANRGRVSQIEEAYEIHQDDSIFTQLWSDGVRALHLAIQLDKNEISEFFDDDGDDDLRLVHGPLDYGGFTKVLELDIIPFLEYDEAAVLSLDLEIVAADGDAALLILDKLSVLLSTMEVNGVPMKNLTFKYNDTLWQDHSDWPTLDEMRDSNQRFVIFTDQSEIIDQDLGIMYKEQIIKENAWNEPDAEGKIMDLEECEGRYEWGVDKVSLDGNDRWTRLFYMNHFCCDTGYDASPMTSDDQIGGGINGWGILYPRIEQCMSTNGKKKPNYLAIDWVGMSPDVREIKDYLNFGGRLGTGQKCLNDSQCATSSCNIKLGVCQCQECFGALIGDEQVCPGCNNDEYCFSPGDGELNECKTTSISTTTIESFCLTKDQCDQRRQNLGFEIFYVGDFPTKGCFYKSDNAYFGIGGTMEEITAANLPGVQKRIWCEDTTLDELEQYNSMKNPVPINASLQSKAESAIDEQVNGDCFSLTKYPSLIIFFCVLLQLT